MYDWMKKIHMYSGLLSFMALLVWGVTGIHAVFLPAPGEWKDPAVTGLREFQFEGAGDVDDKKLAQSVYHAADIAMSGGYFNVRRDDSGNLTFQTYTPNGRRDVTYLEKERKVRIELRDSGLGGFLSSMHAGSSRRGPPELSARLWGYYNEFSTWAFLFMTLSGIYLWIAARPGMPWAWILAAVMLAATGALWIMTR